MKRLEGKCALVTGGTQGLGLEAASALAAEGASVMICARDEARLGQAVEVIRAASPGAVVSGCRADVSDRQDVASLVRHTCAELGGLDILFANAGIYGPIGPIDEVDMDEWVTALNINLMGVVFCCRESLPVMKQQRSGKIIITSGGGATKPMPNFSAYAASKAGVVRFAETLALEVQEYGIAVNVVAPGALNTRLLEQVLAAGPSKTGKTFYESSIRQRDSGGDSAQQAAALCAFLASADSDGISGKLISARWDPWKTMTKHIDELKGSDIYTLRRIVPDDRGKDWGKQ